MGDQRVDAVVFFFVAMFFFFTTSIWFHRSGGGGVTAEGSPRVSLQVERQPEATLGL
jgi:hypothetical protein